LTSGGLYVAPDTFSVYAAKALPLYRLCDAIVLLHPVVVRTSVKTVAAAAAADDNDDGSLC